jgi:drug/metabolite transporter (DMT)-like permease
VIAFIFAVAAAASNALASVLQRRAARDKPRSESFRPALILDLLRTPVWLGGIGALIGGFLLQGAALNFGELAAVQPILVVELPFTLLVAGLIFHRSLGRRAWLGAVAVSAGLALALATAAPSGGRSTVPAMVWLVAAAVTVGLVAVLVGLGKKAAPDSARAALLGAAAGVGFGFTAALIKGVTGHLSGGVASFFGSWQLYAMVVAGIASVYLLQNALQSGTLVAAQPAITTSDPLVSIGYGVAMFHEQLRLGIWLVPELVGLALVIAGSAELARSPLVTGEKDPE